MKPTVRKITWWNPELSVAAFIGGETGITDALGNAEIATKDLYDYFAQLCAGDVDDREFKYGLEFCAGGSNAFQMFLGEHIPRCVPSLMGAEVGGLHLHVVLQDVVDEFMLRMEEILQKHFDGRIFAKQGAYEFLIKYERGCPVCELDNLIHSACRFKVQGRLEDLVIRYM